MKRLLLLCLSAILLLSACNETDGAKKETTKSTTSAATTSATTTTAEPEPEIPEIEYTMLDGKTAVNDEKNLIDCEIDIPSDFQYPIIYLYKDKILVCEYAHNGGETDTKINMAMISLVDGEVLCRNSYESENFITFLVTNEYLSIFDYDIGEIKILDDNFEVTKTYKTGDSNSGDIFMTDTPGVIYSIRNDSGLFKVDLETGESEEIIRSPKIELSYSDDNYIYLQYIPDDSSMFENVVLDRKSGTLSPNTLERSAYYIRRFGDFFIYEKNFDYTHTYFNYNGVEKKIATEDSVIRTTKNSQNFTLSQNSQYKTDYVRLYSPDGKYISGFTNPLDGVYLDTEFQYSEEYGGYFIISNDMNGAQLYFWDISVETEGEDIVFEDVVPEVEYAAVVPDYIRKKINRIESTYGVDIKVFDECDSEVACYDLVFSNDEYEVSSFLDILESCMAKYPDGFFQQIKYGNVGEIEIQIVFDIVSKDDIMDAAAFVTVDDDKQVVVFDALCFEYEVYHEFTHVIDNFLTFKTKISDEMVFNEEDWSALNPAGFVYAESGNNSDLDYLYNYYYYGNEDYFAMEYGCANSMEDRATLMGSVMSEYSIADCTSPQLVAKKNYWSQCIRDGFDTTGWPEKTLWEK